jgi:myo-inositol-1(or 4)-monophosphatase
VQESSLMQVLEECAAAVGGALERLVDWDRPGERPGQYGLDLAADRAAVAVLVQSGLAVLSEESGLTYPERSLLAVLDPVDGSTNASRRLPWYATSIAVLDEEGPLVALVLNQASGVCYRAVRGGGATKGGQTLRLGPGRSLSQALVAVSGLPPRPVPWGQTRALGASALDMCAVADGSLDAFCDYGDHAHGPWDYLGALLVCMEAGAVVTDALGRGLVVRTHEGRRAPVTASSPALLSQVLQFRKMG